MTAQQSGARPAGRRAVLVSSPHAGNAAHTDEVAAHLARAGIVVAQRLLVSDLDHAQPQGRRWREQGHDLVIAAGGDGTIGSVATQLAGSDLPLAILPLGTANDVARSLYLPMDIEAACALLADAEPMEMDVGQALPGLTEPGAYSSAREEPPSAGGMSPGAGVSFLHTATLGLNVEFARLATDTQRRQRLGSLTYAASALEAVAHYHAIDVTLRLYGVEGADEPDEQIIHSHAVQVSIVNTPVFGGKMGLRLPDVSVRDRLLDFMLIEAVDAQQLRRTVQQMLAALGSGGDRPVASHHSHEHTPGVRRFRAQAAMLETASAVDVTLDGEIRTHTPVMVRVAPQPLRVLAPPQAKRLLAREHGLSGSTAAPNTSPEAETPKSES